MTYTILSILITIGIPVLIWKIEQLKKEQKLTNRHSNGRYKKIAVVKKAKSRIKPTKQVTWIGDPIPSKQRKILVTGMGQRSYITI